MSTHYSHTFPQQQQLQLVQGKPHRLVLGTSTQIRDEVSTGEVSHSFRARPTPTRSCSVSLTSTKMSSQLTHRDCKSLFSTLTKKYDCLEGSNGFNLWQMQTKEHVMVYLRPSAVCYIHNSLQRPDWGRAFPVSHQEVYRTFLWILLCFFHSDTNLLQKETTKLSLLLILLLFSICTAQRKQDEQINTWDHPQEG